jgi:hypothetical protein
MELASSDAPGDPSAPKYDPLLLMALRSRYVDVLRYELKELEYELWAAVVSGPREYGRLQVSAEHIAQLRKLSQAASGWIVFDDENEETFCP